MAIKMKYVAPLLAAGAAAATIAVAPAAFAADQPCSASSSGTVCQSAGNVQIKTNSPHVQFHPYGDEAWLLFHH
jgi:hypothetical protein